MRAKFSLAVAVLCGCNGAPGSEYDIDAVDTLSQAIVGGSEDSGDPAVVALYIEVKEQGASLCTATLVSPRVLVTAAHCLSPAELGGTPTVRVYLGHDLHKATQSQLLPTIETHFNANWSSTKLSNGYDVGVVILKDPINNITPKLMNRIPLTQQQIGRAVRMVGYGTTTNKVNDAGLKRQTQTTLSGYNDKLLEFRDPNHGTCNGDSGGPAFMNINGAEMLVGITSFGEVSCLQGGYDTRLDTIISYVDQYIDVFDPASMNSTLSSASRVKSDGTSALLKTPGIACVEDNECSSGSCVDLLCSSTPRAGEGNEIAGGCSVGGTRPASPLALLLLAMLVLVRRHVLAERGCAARSRRGRLGTLSGFQKH